MPRPDASTTSPTPGAPARSTTWPSTIRGAARRKAKVSPVWAVLVLTWSTSSTSTGVPAATWQQGSWVRAEAPGATAKVIASVIHAVEDRLLFIDLLPGVRQTTKASNLTNVLDGFGFPGAVA